MDCQLSLSRGNCTLLDVVCLIRRILMSNTTMLRSKVVKANAEQRLVN
jgi:hypothetical protein